MFRGVMLALEAALLAAGLTGCEDLPQIRYETEHLRIGTSFDEDVCAGSLRLLEDHLVLVEGALGVTVRKPIELYWYDEIPDGVCKSEFEEVRGCANAGTRQVHTRWVAARHELAHAVAWDLGDADEVFAEGFAAAFEGERTELGWQSPGLTVGHSGSDVDLPSAAHFVRWLLEEHPSASFRTLLRESSSRRGPKHARRAFQEAYGVTLEQLEAEFFERAPELSPALGFCDFEEVEWSDELDFSLDLDCDEDHTRGVRTMTRSVVFEVPTEGLYVLELDDPAQVVVFRCYDEAVPVGEPLPPKPRAPVGEDEGGQNAVEPLLLRGVHELELVAARYRVDVLVDGQTPVTARMRLHPKIGPP